MDGLFSASTDVWVRAAAGPQERDHAPQSGRRPSGRRKENSERDVRRGADALHRA